MPRLVTLGLAAAGLFSITFIVNRAMSLSGGHWAWNALLRYIFTAAIIGLWIFVRKGPLHLAIIGRAFINRLRFWVFAGGIGYGLFYSTICLSAATAPGWVVAVTWQLTIVASPIVLLAFGLRLPNRGILYVIIIFIGVLAVNAGELADSISIPESLQSALPVMIAAIAYPIGNQMLNMARHDPSSPETMLLDTSTCVLLMSLGAIPFLGILVLVVAPPSPSIGQVGGSLLVAFVAGTLATSLFTYARNLSADPYRIAAVDATQAAEVVFALAGEIMLLGAPLPNPISWFGLLILMFGLVGFAWK